MISKHQSLPESEGNALLRRLFEVAVRRLHDRGISMRYQPSVIQWLLIQPDWQTSLNPLRTLDGHWHRQVARRIEQLLLEKRLKAGDSLGVGLVDMPEGADVEFEIATSMVK